MGSYLTIVGLGYVGLPLAVEACRAGLSVTGFDTSALVVDGLNAGRSHVDDLADKDVAATLRAGFSATRDPSCIADSEVVVICVPTPLSNDGTPDLSSVMDATRTIAQRLNPNCLVVLESTTYPGTTDGVVRASLEEVSGLVAGVDFALAYSPERIDPGNKTHKLRNTPKVVGGLTPQCTESAVDFYSQIVDTVVPTVGVREAELAKLLENTYRHINIALVNELVVFAHELGIDLWAAIDAAKTKPFGFEAFYPGPGVGGHCIPIDPNYLSWVVRSIGYRFRLVELAGEVLERMPAYVAKRVQETLNSDQRPVNGSSILILGVTYKANVGDQRETPARPLAERLLQMGAKVSFFDPHVDEFQTASGNLTPEDDLSEALSRVDLAVLIAAHDQIVNAGCLGNARMILDTRGVLEGDNVERL